MTENGNVCQCCFQQLKCWVEVSRIKCSAVYLKCIDSYYCITWNIHFWKLKIERACLKRHPAPDRARPHAALRFQHKRSDVVRLSSGFMRWCVRHVWLWEVAGWAPAAQVACLVSGWASGKCHVEVDTCSFGYMAQWQWVPLSCKPVVQEKHCLECIINIMTFRTWTDSFCFSPEQGSGAVACTSVSTVRCFEELCQKLRCKWSAGISED